MVEPASVAGSCDGLIKVSFTIHAALYESVNISAHVRHRLFLVVQSCDCLSNPIAASPTTHPILVWSLGL